MKIIAVKLTDIIIRIGMKAAIAPPSIIANGVMLWVDILRKARTFPRISSGVVACAVDSRITLITELKKPPTRRKIIIMPNIC